MKAEIRNICWAIICSLLYSYTHANRVALDWTFVVLCFVFMGLAYAYAHEREQKNAEAAQ